MFASGGFPVGFGDVAIVLLVVAIIHGAVYLTRIGDRMAELLGGVPSPSTSSELEPGPGSQGAQDGAGRQTSSDG